VNGWITLQTFIAFVLGVIMSAMVKGFVSSARSKIA
jgi:hypothetical protein